MIQGPFPVIADIVVDQQYNEFRQDIEILTGNLSNLASVIHRAQAEILHNARPPTATLRNVSLVVGNFRSALEDCWSLLDQRASFGNRQGPVYNLRWFLRVRDDVQMLRDRIATCNIKLSIALGCLELYAVIPLRSPSQSQTR